MTARSPEDHEPSDSTERHAARARRDGPQHFDALYERLAPAIFTWACLRIHPSLRSRLEPDDLVQEIWWRAMDGFSGFDPMKGSFRGWIFGIATRTLLNNFRYLRTHGELKDADRERPQREAMPSSVVAEATSVSQRAARSETTQRLLAHVAALDRDDQVLFAHCALEGRPARQAAELMSIGPDAAAKRWQRLRERLRQAITAGEIADADAEVVVTEAD